MAAGWTKFKKADVLEAIKSSGGVKLLVCQRLKCDRGTFDRYLDRYPNIATAFENEKEEVGDLVESKIISGIKEGNVALTIFYAKTKLKDRGYTERQEIDHTRPIVLKIDEDDAQA